MTDNTKLYDAQADALAAILCVHRDDMASLRLLVDSYATDNPEDRSMFVTAILHHAAGSLRFAADASGVTVEKLAGTVMAGLNRDRGETTP